MSNKTVELEKKIVKLRDKNFELNCINFNWKLYSVVMSFLFVILFVVYIFAANNIDENVLGRYMCKQHDLEFEKTESEGMNLLNLFNVAGVELEDMSLRVYCREPKQETQIDDGYLILTK